jgi:Suppressor of fused protein (SUFU)
VGDGTPGGSEIVRHEFRERGREPSSGDPELIDAIDRHLERAFGDDGNVFHELVSDLVHLDVHFIPARGERSWSTLVTCGMAERPMTVPDSLEEYRYAELLLALPSDWPLTEDAFADERVYWPIRLLKDLGRLPHEFETFLYYGHSIPNGDPPEPYAAGTKLCGALISPPLLVPDGFEQLQVSDDRVVHFYAVSVLHRDELEYKLEHGAEALWERLDEAGVTELVDPARASVVGRRGLLGRR